jgi:hypothetical protein
VTSAAIALRARAERIRVAASADVIALASVALLFALLSVLTWGTWGDLDSDTGYDVVAGMRVAHGELPYGDFTYYYGPLAPLATGLAAWIGGDGFAPAIVLGFAITIGLIAATYALARTFVGPLGSFLAAALTAAVAFIPNNYNFILPHTSSATIGTLLLVLLLLCLRRYALTTRTSWLLAVGGAAGLLTLTKPEVAAAGFAASIVWLVVRGRRGAELGRELAVFGAPAVGIPVAVYGFFLTQVSAHRLFLENLYPVDALNAGGDTLVKARMPLTVGSVAEVTGRLALYAAGCAILLLLAHRLEVRGRLERLPVVACGAAVLIAVAAALAQTDRLREAFYYFYGWIPAGAVVVVAILLVRARRESTFEVGKQTELAVAVALAVVAATSYGAFVTHGWRPQMAVYYIPLVAVFLVRLHLVDLARTRGAWALGTAWIVFLTATGTLVTLKDAHAESVTVRGPGGALTETPQEAALYQAALRKIERNTKPGEPILVAPIMTALYPLSGRKDVMPEISLIPSALPTRADQETAIHQLQRAHVRFAITDRRTWPGYGQTYFGGSFDRLLAQWLHHNFVRSSVLQIHGSPTRVLDVWTR